MPGLRKKQTVKIWNHLEKSIFSFIKFKNSPSIARANNEGLRARQRRIAILNLWSDLSAVTAQHQHCFNHPKCGGNYYFICFVRLCSPQIAFHWRRKVEKRLLIIMFEKSFSLSLRFSSDFLPSPTSNEKLFRFFLRAHDRHSSYHSRKSKINNVL